MYELECLRRRTEDASMTTNIKDTNSILSASTKSPSKSVKSPTMSAKSSKSPKTPRSKSKSNGSAGKSRTSEIAEVEAEEDKFTGHSCLLITWKTNPEVENFKDRYMDKEIKTHKRKNTNMVDPGDLVTEKSLSKYYRIIGKVIQLLTQTTFQRNFKTLLQGEGVERLLVKGKKGQVEEVDGDPYRYFLLAGTSHPYPDDTFYSVGRVPRKLLMKYLGVKMYLVRLKASPVKVRIFSWRMHRS